MRRIGALAATLLLGACTMNPAPASPQPSAPEPQQSRFTTTEPLPSGVPSGVPTTLPEPRLTAIRNDLGTRGVAIETLRVVSAENVTFNDGSLGCPRPGVQYTQALVDGMRVVVAVGGRTYDYRFGTGDTPVLCERAFPRASGSTR